MQVYAETPRLLLREMLPEDAPGMFELDADPQVHTYLGNRPVQRIEEVEAKIRLVRLQYIENGVGRCSVVEKQSGDFIGWAGLKLITEPINGRANYYDLGYRFVKRVWGQGYATEAGSASLDYGFETLQLTTIYAMADLRNAASRRVLEKLGLRQTEIMKWRNTDHGFLHIERSEWLATKSSNPI